MQMSCAVLLHGTFSRYDMAYKIALYSNSISIGDQLFVFCLGSNSVIIRYNTRYLYLNSEEATIFTSVLKKYGATYPSNVEIIHG